MSDRGYRRPRPLSPLREHLRDTFWFAPTMGFVCVFVLWLVATELDDAIVTLLQREEAYDELGELIAFSQDAKTIVTTISSAMMTFIGVVFSISLVAVQMASGQLTPRVVRIFVRSRISKLTLTVFLATFLFSLLVLSSYESESDPRRVVSVPLATTAVQCLDRIVQFLAAVAHLPLGAVHHRDRDGRVRLVQDGPEWDDLVDLAFEEIRWCVAGSPQVSRRLMAGLDDLLLIVPEDRKKSLVRHRALLVQTVERTVPVAADREFALLPDRQGIG
ncbi:DUF2254 family protein [Streptomyces anulatus]|uniref:DUF2254 family protein n=1 Tax=Streptomyces anulatus TaxID=1892 RepID=UPI0036A98E87